MSYRGKFYLYYLLVVTCGLIWILIVTGCIDGKEKNNVIQHDVELTSEYINIIDSLQNKYNKDVDSLSNKLDTVCAENIVLKYKIERVKYYNSIAAKGNNIKYLRGWINRTLE